MFAQRLTILGLVLGLALGFGAARPSHGSAGETRHVVRPGETLWTIAEQRYGGDPRAAVWRIQEHNGLAGSALRPGVVLYLPP